MNPEIIQGIVFIQVLLLVLAFIFTAAGKRSARSLAWISTLMAIASLVLFGLVMTKLGFIKSTPDDVKTYAIYSLLSIAAAMFTWGCMLILKVRESATSARLDRPAARTRAAEELRAILQKEGIELDGRLEQARKEREEFLYHLEDRHARQIAGLAQEYQHEANTILGQLLDQLAADQLQPLVEQRLAEHQKKIESELGAIDSAVAGETLTSLRNDLSELLEKVDATESRVAKIREENPDSTMEDHVNARLAAIDSQIDDAVAAAKGEFDTTLAATIEAVETRIDGVGALLDDKIDAASNPLALRMAETEKVVEARLQQYEQVLTTRFAETEQILNGRVSEQESALEVRVHEVELRIDERLQGHAGAIEQVLADHDKQLHEALEEQSGAVADHFNGERERMMSELSEHATSLQEQVAGELITAETRARETVEATQVAWNQFTEELEERFAATREEALRAAKEIAAAERAELEKELQSIAESASSDIAQKVEMLGREAAWQRAQVERAVFESTELLKNTAQDALANADHLFSDLERMGAERVEKIRRQAEDALVQSRDYVSQLQTSLGTHLDQLRESSADLGNEMNERLESIATASQQAAQHLEAYSRDIVDSASRELNAVSEQQIDAITQRIGGEMTNNIQTNLNEQQRQYELHLNEIAQRIAQQVQGDLAGLAEHARGAITGELEQIAGQAREQARSSQEQGHLQIMNELARQQQELAERTREAADTTRRMLDDALGQSRRQLEEAMASMGAHMREELVRFHDEGQRRVNTIVEQLRGREHEMLRDEDRKLGQARQELLQKHQSALEGSVRSMVGNLSSAVTPPVLGTPLSSMAPAAPAVPATGGLMSFSAQVQPPAAGSFAADVNRPSTPLGTPAMPMTQGFDPNQPQPDPYSM